MNKNLIEGQELNVEKLAAPGHVPTAVVDLLNNVTGELIYPTEGSLAAAVYMAVSIPQNQPELRNKVLDAFYSVLSKIVDAGWSTGSVLAPVSHIKLVSKDDPFLKDLLNPELAMQPRMCVDGFFVFPHVRSERVSDAYSVFKDTMGSIDGVSFVDHPDSPDNKQTGEGASFAHSS